jgi:hypothetical protein
MDAFIGKTLMVVVIVSFAVKWAMGIFASSNPEEAEAIKKAASEKLVSVIKGRLK